MQGGEIALAALGILATAVGALVWLLKKLFSMNTDNIVKIVDALDRNNKISDGLKKVLDRILERMDKDDKDKEMFQAKVCEILNKISLEQDKIAIRQIKMDNKQNDIDEKQDRLLDSIVTKTMTVENMTVHNETVEDKHLPLTGRHK